MKMFFTSVLALPGGFVIAETMQILSCLPTGSRQILRGAVNDHSTGISGIDKG